MTTSPTFVLTLCKKKKTKLVKVKVITAEFLCYYLVCTKRVYTKKTTSTLRLRFMRIAVILERLLKLGII